MVQTRRGWPPEGARGVVSLLSLADCGGHFIDRNANYDGQGCAARRGIGVMFFCPLCVKAGLPWADCHSLFVHFKVGLDGLPVPEETRRWKEKDPKTGVETEVVFTLPRWGRVGDTIAGLTLDPSINAEKQQHSGHMGWHGHIRKGAMEGGGV